MDRIPRIPRIEESSLPNPEQGNSSLEATLNFYRSIQEQSNRPPDSTYRSQFEGAIVSPIERNEVHRNTEKTMESAKSLIDNFYNVLDHMQIKENEKYINMKEEELSLAEQRTGGMVDLRPDELQHIVSSYQVASHDVAKLHEYITKVEELKETYTLAVSNSAQKERGLKYIMEDTVSRIDRLKMNFEASLPDIAMIQEKYEQIYTRGSGRDIKEDIRDGIEWENR